jgi:outer membrane murein-binding lipoprotein Lpp
VIDFRYHLVSIVSIFLALAVGIVLGAGPLKEDLGNTLTSEVKSLRTDKAQLRAELDAAEKGNQARDEFTAASNKSLLPGRLTGTTVAVVVLPGAPSSLVKSLTEAITSSGGTVGSQVTVLDSWIDPAKATFRSTLGQQLASQVGVPVDQNGSQVLDAVLARSVLTKPGAPTSGAMAALEGLRTGDLIRFTPDQVTPATMAVVVAAPVSGSDADVRQAQAQSLAGLAGELDKAGSGALVAETTAKPGATDITSVVSTVRADGELSKQVSTVDDADIPMGEASMVFGLLEQEAGKAGHYGLGSDATAVYPQLATK